MKLIKSTSGVSPIVATSLLITMVVVTAGIILVWAFNFIPQPVLVEGQNAETYCSKVQLGIDLPKSEEGAYASLGTEPPAPSTGPVDVDVDMVNDGNNKIYGINVVEVRGSDEISKTYLLNIGPGEAKRATLEFNDIEDIEEVRIHPVVLGIDSGSEESSEYTCQSNVQRAKF